MPLSRKAKNDIVAELVVLLGGSKMTVAAEYKGLTVKSIQQLRREAKANGTTIKVVKNRLVVKALQQVDGLKDVDTAALKNQLLYAFNDQDEVAAAQVLNTFAKTNPELQFVGAISGEGAFVAADDVKSLANLPTKDQLRGQLVGTLAAPLTGFMNVLNGNVRGVLNVLNARADALGQ